MTTAVSANPANANTTTPFVEVRPPAASASAASNSNSAHGNEDTVELSNTAQQYLASQSDSTEAEGTVAKLVRAVADGDTGALSLLTVI